MKQTRCDICGNIVTAKNEANGGIRLSRQSLLVELRIIKVDGAPDPDVCVECAKLAVTHGVIWKGD